MFFAEVFGAQYVADDAETFLVQPQPGTELEALEAWRFHSPGTMVINFADVLAPLTGSQVLASYRWGTEGGALVRNETGTVMLLGFPFETIDHGPARAALMQALVDSLP